MPTPERIFQVGELLRRGRRGRGGPRSAAASTCGSSTRCWRSSRSAAHLDDQRPGRRSTRRDWRRAKRLGFADAQLAHLWGVDDASGRRRAIGRRACTRPTRPSTRAPPSSPPSTPYHYSTWEDESEVQPSDRPRVVILGSGPEPHRPGHRVRLLLRPRQLRPARRRLRDGDDQLQPGDRVDRLRHVRPAVLRAAHGRGRRTTSSPPRPRRPAASPPKVMVSLGGQTPLKLASLIPPELVAGTSADVDRPRRGPREVERAVRRAAHPAAAGRHRRRPRPGAGGRRRRSASRCSCARATCSAAGRCGSSTTSTSSRRPWPRSSGSNAPAGRTPARSGARAACPPSGRC